MPNSSSIDEHSPPSAKIPPHSKMSPPLGQRQRDFSRDAQKQDSSPQSRHGQKSRPSNGEKKKSSGMLGFLTLKEPSSSAWEEFAQQQRAAALKGGRPSAVGLAGVSTQKLPDHVPAVNSKWDGVSENAKRKAMDPNKRVSTTSMATQQSSRSEQSFSSDSSGKGSAYRYGSLSSKPPGSRPGLPPSQYSSTYSISVPRNPPNSSEATPWEAPGSRYQYAESNLTMPSRKQQSPSQSSQYRGHHAAIARLSDYGSTSPDASPQTSDKSTLHTCLPTTQINSGSTHQIRSFPSHGSL